MKTVFIYILTVISLFGNEILDEYRKNGIDNVERQLDQALTSQTYWHDVINETDTKFGYMERYSSVLVCDKNLSTLTLYQKDANNTFVMQKVYNAFTGKNKGDKQFEGDLKTPVGIYNLVKKLSSVDEFYGPMAFVTSYPNLYDRFRNKDGHGIWIHGLPINQTREEYTKGCIAIDNDGLECLDRHIDLYLTILLIYENQEIAKTDVDTLANIAAWLYKWRLAWKYNDIDTYLSYYAKDFKRYDGKNFEQFKQYKKAVFAKNEKKSILFNNINIIPYPNHPGIYQITFFEKYKSDNYTFNGPKELLVRLENGSIRIFSEK